MQLQKLEIKELGESPLTRFLHLSSVAVIMVGPLSCVCFANASVREKELKRRLFVCEMACTDYMTGLGLDRVLEKAREAAKLPDVKQVVLYQCCTDFLTHLDYESYLRKHINRKDIRFYTYQRGSASLNYTEKKSVTERMQEDARKDGFELLPVEKSSEKIEAPEEIRIPDFVKVCGVLKNYPVLTCLFSPGSCTGAFSAAGEEESPWLYISRLEDTELITGCSRQFAAEAAKRADLLGTNKICLVGTPVTKILYMEFRQVGELLEKTGYRVLVFETDGYGSGRDAANTAKQRIETLLKEETE